MNEENTFAPNSAALVSARKQAGYSTRTKFISAMDGLLSKDTIKRCEKPPNGYKARLSTFEEFAEFLQNCEAHELYFEDDPTSPHELFHLSDVADCSGRWIIDGHDLEMSPHFVYEGGPRPLQAIVVVRLNVQTGILAAEGDDHDNDPCSFKGHIRESGRVIIGEYAINNGRSHIYGSLVLLYHNCGKLMTGYYTGRGTQKGSEFILGEMKMTRVEE